MLVLPRSIIERLIDPELVRAAVEAAHGALVTGRAAQAARENLEIPGSDVVLVPMVAATAAAEERAAAGMKLLVDSPSNPAVGRPRQQSTVLLIDVETGRCEAVLDGGAITLVRTAAASAVATKHLANPDASTLGLIGAGGQAWAHIQAIGSVRELSRIVVWSRTRETAERLAARCAAAGVGVEVLPDPRAVVQAAEILCTLTPSVTPVVAGEWLRPGQHLNVVGAPPRPDHREVDAEALGRSLVVVDDRRVALAESGAVRAAIEDGTIGEKDLHADLGEIVAGRVVGRSDPTQITLFNSVGVGIQDVVSARLVVDRAIAVSLGFEIAMSR